MKAFIQTRLNVIEFRFYIIDSIDFVAAPTQVTQLKDIKTYTYEASDPATPFGWRAKATLSDSSILWLDDVSVGGFTLPERVEVISPNVVSGSSATFEVEVIHESPIQDVIFVDEFNQQFGQSSTPSSGSNFQINHTPEGRLNWRAVARLVNGRRLVSPLKETNFDNNLGFFNSQFSDRPLESFPSASTSGRFFQYLTWLENPPVLVIFEIQDIEGNLLAIDYEWGTTPHETLPLERAWVTGTLSYYSTVPYKARPIITLQSGRVVTGNWAVYGEFREFEKMTQILPANNESYAVGEPVDYEFELTTRLELTDLDIKIHLGAVAESVASPETTTPYYVGNIYTFKYSENFVEPLSWQVVAEIDAPPSQNVPEIVSDSSAVSLYTAPKTINRVEPANYSSFSEDSEVDLICKVTGIDQPTSVDFNFTAGGTTVNQDTPFETNAIRGGFEWFYKIQHTITLESQGWSCTANISSGNISTLGWWYLELESIPDPLIEILEPDDYQGFNDDEDIDFIVKVTSAEQPTQVYYDLGPLNTDITVTIPESSTDNGDGTFDYTYKATSKMAYDDGWETYWRAIASFQFQQSVDAGGYVYISEAPVPPSEWFVDDPNPTIVEPNVSTTYTVRLVTHRTTPTVMVRPTGGSSPSIYPTLESSTVLGDGRNEYTYEFDWTAPNFNRVWDSEAWIDGGDEVLDFTITAQFA